jgi:hypothetical protein
MPLSPEEINQLRHAAAQQQEQQRQAFHQHLVNEEQKLLEKGPAAWRDNPELAKKEIGEVKRHLIDHHGYTEQDLLVFPDHRSLLAARELMLSHQREAEARRRQAEEHVKRERAKKAEADKAAEQQKLLGETKKKLRKNYGSTHAQAEALADAFGVNE